MATTKPRQKRWRETQTERRDRGWGRRGGILADRRVSKRTLQLGNVWWGEENERVGRQGSSSSDNKQKKTRKMMNNEQNGWRRTHEWSVSEPEAWPEGSLTPSCTPAIGKYITLLIDISNDTSNKEKLIFDEIFGYGICMKTQNNFLMRFLFPICVFFLFLFVIQE